MLIDCDTCSARGSACQDCLVQVLLGAPAGGTGSGVELDGAERAAMAVLAGSGLVPPLRLVPRTSASAASSAGDEVTDGHQDEASRPSRRAAG